MLTILPIQKTISAQNKTRFANRFLTAAWVSIALLISGCQSTAPRPATEPDKPPIARETSRESEPSVATSQPTNGGFMPACLNVTEGDRQLEFNNEELVITNTGKVVTLVLDQGVPVKCEKLRIIEGARTPSAEIVFMTRPTGTSIQIADRKLGVASLKDGRWIVKPFVVDRMMQDEKGLATDPHATTKWTVDAGRPVLSRTDVETGKTETFKP